MNSAESIQVITTSRLGEVAALAQVAESWKRELGAKTVLMVEAGEARKRKGEVLKAREIFDDINEYTLGSNPWALNGKGPTIKEVLSRCKASAEVEIVVFLNADIEIARGSSALASRIREGLISSRLILFQRIETSLDGREIRRYSEGFDGFAVNPQNVGDVDEVLGLMRIGQVGWDYALPLCFEKKMVRVWCGSEFRHKIHATGSSLQWEDAITRLSFAIDKSWKVSAEKKRQLALLFGTLCLRWAELGLVRFASSRSSYKRCLVWLGCRVMYYGFIKPELGSIQKLDLHDGRDSVKYDQIFAVSDVNMDSGLNS